jgi:F0F1-type ATP synthase membrane subunit c/vacuolar-type H+-ATPase subunit K
MIQAARIIGTGLGFTELIGAGLGIGVVFGALILGVARNPTLKGQLRVLYTKIKKHFTLTNLIIGMVSIVIAAFIKEFGTAQFILNYIGIYNSVFSECLLAGSLGLMVRLGLRGLIEEFEFTTPQTMADGGGNSESMNLKDKSGIHCSEPPVPSSSSNPTTSSNPAGASSNPTGAPSRPTVPSSSDPARASSYSPGYGSRRVAYILNKKVEDMSTQISSLTTEIENSSDPPTKAQMEEELSELFEDLKIFSSMAAEETRKGFTSEQGLSSKRDLDSSEDESSSNKRR